MNLRSVLKLHRSTKIIIDFLRKIGFLHLLHLLQNKKILNEFGGAGEEFSNLYKEHKSEFDKVLNLLCDEKSKEIYKAVIRYRMTRDLNIIYKFVTIPAYFQEDIYIPKENERFLDGGAFIGDTIRDFCDICSRDGIKNFHIYAWEADPINANKIKKNAGLFSDKVDVLEYALWSKEDILSFQKGNDASSMVTNKGEYNVNARAIDEIHINDSLTYIKMDIEGAEIEALKGAKETICTQKPTLAICIYHKSEHLYQIPLLIHRWVPEYKFYVRHHSDSIFDTVLYAKL